MKKWLILFILIILIAAISVKICMDTNEFKVNTVQYNTNKIPEGTEFTVLQISDLHNKVFGSHNEKLINIIEQLNADIIVLTGDLIDRDTEHFKDVFSFVENITTINEKVFFVTGNHEWDNIHTEKFLDGLRERNVTILSNKHTQITAGEVRFNLVGIDNASTNHENMTDAFHSINEELYTILLSHTPGVTEKYQDIPANLVLSGHTHGGQIRLPLIGAVIAPDEGFFPRLEKGTYKIGEEKFLYIDSGLGTSVAPIRFLNKSQLSLIQITGN